MVDNYSIVNVIVVFRIIFNIINLVILVFIVGCNFKGQVISRCNIEVCFNRIVYIVIFGGRNIGIKICGKI